MTMPLFGEVATDPKPLPARLADMHRVYGDYPGNICGDCAHFIRYQQGTRWAKCELTRQSGGAATDWRARWTACGRFETK